MRQSIIQSLRFPQTKLAPSKINGAGVGVFAIDDIPADYPIFGPKGETYFVRWNETPDVSDATRVYIRSICHSNEEGFWIDRHLDQIDGSFYINHSENPNTWHDSKADIFYSNRRIEAGEELTCLYPMEERDWL
jgi:hypothetical protein